MGHCCLHLQSLGRTLKRTPVNVGQYEGRPESKDLLPARPHTAATTQAMLQEISWEIFDHLTCSSDWDPRDFYLFPTLKTFLGSRRFESDEEVEEAVKEWLTLRRLMSYTYGAPILDVSRSHTTTQHSR